MEIHGDDLCVQCGGIRVAKSTLCADCLAIFFESAAADNMEKSINIKELEKKNKKLTGLCERLLDHIRKDTVYTGELEQAIYTFWRKNWKEGEDEKSRIHDNK